MASTLLIFVPLPKGIPLEAVGDVYSSALIELGLILFVITFIVLALAKLLLLQLARGEGRKT